MAELIMPFSTNRMDPKTKDVSLEQFVDSLIAEKKDFAELDAELKAQIKEDLLERVENRVKAIIFANIPKNKMADFEEMMDKNASDEKVQNFCASNIPNLAEIIAAELLVFRQTFIA